MAAATLEMDNKELKKQTEDIEEIMEFWQWKIINRIAFHC